MTHMWHSWRIVPTIQELVQHDAFSLHTLYISQFCTGLPYSIGPILELTEVFAFFVGCYTRFAIFLLIRKWKQDSTDTEHMHCWMQLAIFGRDPKSAVASFLEQQEFQFWQKKKKIPRPKQV